MSEQRVTRTELQLQILKRRKIDLCLNQRLFMIHNSFMSFGNISAARYYSVAICRQAFSQFDFELVSQSAKFGIDPHPLGSRRRMFLWLELFALLFGPSEDC